MSLPPVVQSRCKLVVVLTMHRSGSSVVTRGLQVLNVDLGTNLMPASYDNKKGFWEDLDIHLLNIEMLQALNSDWYYVSSLKTKDVEFLCEKGFLNRAIELMQQKMNGVEAFGVKDPQITKLLPFWERVFQKCKCEVSYILAIRNPVSVVKSLQKRDELIPTHSYYLWFGYMLSGIKGCLEHKYIVVDYDIMMSSPEKELNRLAVFLNLQINIDRLIEFNSKFLDSKMQHTISNLDDLISDNDCPEVVHEVYEELQQAGSGEINSENSRLIDKTSSWIRDWEEIKPALLFLDSLLSKTSENRGPYPRKHSIFRNFRTISGVGVVFRAAVRRIYLLFRQS